MFARNCLLPILLIPALAIAQDDGDTAAQLRRLIREKDDAPVELIEQIGKARTREAALGLIEAYDKVATILFRREILRAMAQFVNLPDSQQPVLDKLAEIATKTQEDDLRELTLHTLAQSPTIGKQLLKKIVDTEGMPDQIREPAMREHIRLASADDAEWYRFLWNLEQKQRKDSSGAIRAPELNTIRQLAVEGLLPQLSETEIVEALKREYDPKIRRAALDWMQRQSMPRAAEMAEWLLDRVDFPGVDRAAAARIVAQAKGPKVATATFIKLAKKRDVTPEDLRLEMARLIADSKDDAVRKQAAKLVGKGKPHEKVFALHAAASTDDPKVLAAIRKSLTDESLDVRRAAAEVLAERRDKDALEPLRKMLAGKADPADVRIAIEAIHKIEGPMSAWLKELAGYCASPDRDVRNAAIAVLGSTRDKRQLEPLLAALANDDWSTRFVAVDAVAELRDKAAVPKLIERIGVETGRMRKHVAEALWRLTAQPFDEDVERWKGWWAEASKDFEVVGEKDLDKAEKERERRRLTQRTTTQAKFFGIKVESHRVIFIIDISGSMLESMYGRTVDGRGAARIDVAKQELTQAIENLEPGALFNIYAFSSSVARWQKEGIGVNTNQDKKDAIEWVQRLGASGATNLYDSIKTAFDDPDVDTIFILSDGEPTNGAVIDPYRIREDVAFWNQHRRIKINSIAIGGNLEVLEWLAKDAGGTYRQMR